MSLGCFLLVGMLLYPFTILSLQQAALLRLGLNPAWVSILPFAMLMGGFVNLPLWIRRSTQLVPCAPCGLLGLPWLQTRVMAVPSRQIVAINVGGGLIPILLSALCLHQLPVDHQARFALILGVVILVARASSRLEPGVGVLMRPLQPALAAALLASLLSAPGLAPLLAFPAGTLGVLLGADILRIPEILHNRFQFASIGGAGTFDGILITGLLATLLS